MGVWDTTTPAGSANVRDGDDRIREMKVAIQEALRGGATEGDEAVFPGTSPASAPVFRYRGLKGNTAGKPAAGQYGLYFNTTTGRMERDNGSAWEDVAPAFADLIPATTKMVFYQATAPTGWTRDTTAGLNNKFIGIVTAGSPGTTGGSANLGSEAAHTHTYVHTHEHAHEHNLDSGGWARIAYDAGENIEVDFLSSITSWVSNYAWAAGNTATGVGDGYTRGVELDGLTGAADDATTDSQSASTTSAGSSHTHTHAFANHEVCYSMIATKDAY